MKVTRPECFRGWDAQKKRAVPAGRYDLGGPTALVPRQHRQHSHRPPSPPSVAIILSRQIRNEFPCDLCHSCVVHFPLGRRINEIECDISLDSATLVSKHNSFRIKLESKRISPGNNIPAISQDTVIDQVSTFRSLRDLVLESLFQRSVICPVSRNRKRHFSVRRLESFVPILPGTFGIPVPRHKL
jgi:hypothetical protein